MLMFSVVLNSSNTIRKKKNAFNQWSQAFIYQTRKFLKYIEIKQRVASILEYIKLDIITYIILTIIEVWELLFWNKGQFFKFEENSGLGKTHCIFFVFHVSLWTFWRSLCILIFDNQGFKLLPLSVCLVALLLCAAIRRCYGENRVPCGKVANSSFK